MEQDYPAQTDPNFEPTLEFLPTAHMNNIVPPTIKAQQQEIDYLKTQIYLAHQKLKDMAEFVRAADAVMEGPM